MAIQRRGVWFSLVCSSLNEEFKLWTSIKSMNTTAKTIYNPCQSIWRVWLTAFALPIEDKNKDQQKDEEEDGWAHRPTSYYPQRNLLCNERVKQNQTERKKIESLGFRLQSATEQAWFHESKLYRSAQSPATDTISTYFDNKNSNKLCSSPFSWKLRMDVRSYAPFSSSVMIMVPGPNEFQAVQL